MVWYANARHVIFVIFASLLNMFLINSFDINFFPDKYYSTRPESSEEKGKLSIMCSCIGQAKDKDKEANQNESR